MAASDTAQQADMKQSWLEALARLEARRMLSAETKAIFANILQKRAETPSAEPAKNVLTKTQRQRIIMKALFDLHSVLSRDSFLAVSKAIEKHADFSRDEQSSANAK